MASKHFCEPFWEGWWWSSKQEGHKIRPLNSVICLLGAQRCKNLGEVVKMFVT